ncbi:MAG: three-Cys-motif partner protein TcmP [Bacteroidales bacterium]|nr:three-Cys-motif partner protein TcmP [Bacteroidales bacterium]
MDLHRKPFDEGTITKLEIFENYASEWLPTFIMSYTNSDLWIFDFFAGTGYDSTGVAGSSIRILQQVDKQVGNIFSQNIRINLCFNEYDKDKFALLQNSCNEFVEKNNGLKRLQDSQHLVLKYRNCDFADLFPKTISTIQKCPSLLYLDQNGMKFLADKYLLTLEKLPTVDFLYYLSSSYFIRFGNTPQFQTNMNVDLEKARQNPYKFIHKSILEQLREKIPNTSSLKLYPFTIKKGTNIYGIIFGAKHPRAVDKFLKTVWNKNKINGEANFDIDDDLSKSQLDLFEEKSLTKIEYFQKQLKELVLSGKLVSNKDVYDYVLEQGHIPPHASEVISAMKKDNLLTYESKSPLINYEQVYQKKRVLKYNLL